MRALISILFIASLGAGPGTAQDKPNFTGSWKDTESTATSERTNEIDHRDPNLTIRTKASHSGGHLGVAISDSRSYATDGSEQMAASGPGLARWSAARWQGSTLVLTTVRKRDHAVTFTRETWTLSADGRTLTKSRYVISPSGASESRQVLAKQ